MKRLLRAVAALVVVACGAASAFAGVVWWSSDASVSRFDPETGRLSTLVTSERIHALASSAQGGAWTVRGDTLVHVDADFVTTASATLEVDLPRGPVFLASVADGGIWVAHGTSLHRFDRAGKPLTSWRHGASVSALAVGGPRAVWVADASGVHQYTEDGVVVRSIGTSNLGVPSAMLLDTAGGYLWLLGADFAVQFDALLHFGERVRVGRPPAAIAAAVDPATGTLWFMSQEKLVAFDRDAVAIASLAVPAGTVAEPSALAIDVDAKRLWIGDIRGVTALNAETLQWIRLSGGDPTLLIAEAFHSVLPTLVPGGVIVGPPTTIRFLIGASCNGAPCAAAARYRRNLDLRATIPGIEVGSRLAVDFDTGTANLRDVESLVAGTGPLRVSVSDSFGNRSEELEIDLRAAVQPRPKVLPVTSITAPANNAIFVAPATIAIAATASDSDGTITKVEFYRAATLLGTDTTSPYTYTWSNAPVGTYGLTVKAYDNAGGVTTSAIVNIQVKANVAPSVTLTAPANNAAYTAPATIVMTATAADSDGTVAKVEFYQGTTKVGTDTAAPYTFTWSNVAGGTYTLTAKATDDKGAVTTSNAVTVKVNRPPTVALTAPANNTTLVTPVNVTISASASDGDGTVSKVEFFRNGVLLATDATSPYSFVWNNVPIGTYTLTAKATDNLGATTISAARTLTVNANQPPVVTLMAPTSGTSVIAGVPIALSATATDSDGTIAKVEFFSDSTLLGIDRTSPYLITVPLALGTSAITAKATDNKGAATTTAPVAVTVVPNQDPVVTLTSPLPEQIFPSLTPPDITIKANATDADGTIANVKFYYLPAATPDNPEPVRVPLGTAASPPYQVTWYAVPTTGTGICDESGCSPYDYTVIAQALDNAGAVVEDSVRITVPSYAPWTITMDTPDWGTTAVFNAPATVVLSAIATPIGPPFVGDDVVKVEFVANGTVVATVNGAANGGPNEYVAVWRSLGAGTRAVTARLYDAAGFVVAGPPATIVVRDYTTPPNVAVTAPAHGQGVLITPTDGRFHIPVAATASDLDGTLANVSLVVDDIAWFNGPGPTVSADHIQAPVGLHVVSATATDNAGAKSTARPVYVQALPSSRLQAVVLTSPAPGAVVSSPVVLRTEVGAPDGGVYEVRYYDGTTFLGAATTPPYLFGVSIANGTHTFKAVAVMYNNQQMASTPVPVTVSGSNAVPSVTLTAPTAGQVFPVGSPITLAATASDADGSIARVEFFVGSGFVGADLTAPYSFAWTPTTARTYTAYARAIDNQTGARSSSVVAFTVGSNALPTVALTAPTSGQAFYAGVPIAIAANAADADGIVTQVEFYAGSTLIGTDTASPYTVNWSAPAAGTYVLTAKATDNSNAVTTSAGVSVTINANAIPAVALSMPRAGQAFVTGGTVNLIATATDGDGSIAGVEFYAGTTLIGSVTIAPYSFAWSNVASGSYTLSVKVIDHRGAVTSSAPVAISVQPLALSVTAPVANASVAADFVLITGTYTAPANSGVTVNGRVARTDGQGAFFVNNFPLAAGTNTLTITLTTAQGQTTTVTQTVTSTGTAPFQLAVEPEVGFAPLTTTFRVSNRGGVPLASFGFANLGPGVLDTSNTTPEAIAHITYAAPGIYLPRVTLTDAAGNTYTQTVGILVQDKAALDRLLKAVWGDFANVLRSSNKVLALQYLSGGAQAKYAPVFEVLLPDLATIVSGWSSPQSGLLAGNIAELGVNRLIEGVNRVFLIYLIENQNGIWQIDAM